MELFCTNPSYSEENRRYHLYCGVGGGWEYSEFVFHRFDIHAIKVKTQSSNSESGWGQELTKMARQEVGVVVGGCLEACGKKGAAEGPGRGEGLKKGLRMS